MDHNIYPRLFASTCSINGDNNITDINITYPLSQCRPETDMDHLNLAYINKYITTTNYKKKQQSSFIAIDK